MSLDNVTTVFVSNEGLAIARFKYDANVKGYWLEYTINNTLWKSHWRQVQVPECDSWRNKPQSVSLAVDNENNLIATILFSYGNIITTRLSTNPNWQTVVPPNRG